MAEYSESYTHKELLAAHISHCIKDGDRTFIGANLAVPRAGNLLAHLGHGPNMKVGIGCITTNLLNEPHLEPFKFSTDFRVGRWAESILIHNDTFDCPLKTSNLFFVGGIQVDKYGNVNLIGVGRDYKKLDFRGPGTLGTCTMSYYSERYYIYLERHDARLLVEKCDYISVFGYGEGGDHRERLGLCTYNEGPSEVISPLCIMDFEPTTKRMRLKSLHPGVSLEEVVKRTGFELVIPDAVPSTAEPTEDELRLLRTRIDVEGLLRQ